MRQGDTAGSGQLEAETGEGNDGFYCLSATLKGCLA